MAVSVRMRDIKDDINDVFSVPLWRDNHETINNNKNNERKRFLVQAVNEAVWTVSGGRLLRCLLVTVEVVISAH